MSDPLSKVDEAVEALAGKSQGQHRDARSVAGVYDINDLGMAFDQIDRKI